MIKNVVILGITAAIVIGLASMLSSKGPEPQTPVNPINNGDNSSPVSSTTLKDIVNANNQFTLELYANLKTKEQGRNLFFSPYSISTALGMVYEGARNETAKQIQSVLHFPEDSSTRRSAVLALHESLNKPNAKYELRAANALWTQEGYKLLDEYTNAVERFYKGHATNVDFIGATESTRKVINGWVEDKTNNKIKNLFPQGVLNQDTRLVLTNATYFKGKWVKRFTASATRNEDFRVSDDKKVPVPMMRRTDKESNFPYAETEKLQVLEMPYDGNELSMLILLPKNDNLKALEASLTPQNLDLWRSELKSQRVDVFIPKFKLANKYFLNENLKAMGMPLAFSEGADLSGMNGKKELFIQQVIHQSFVDVNEEGTEAAAATGVSVGITSVQIGPAIPVFRADHPFIFLIQAKATGNILFLGTVVNPAF